MQTIYKNSTGLTISIVLTSDGAAVNLTGKTLTMNLYSFSTNTLKWTHACTVDVAASGTAHLTTIATDFDTLGDYYSTLVVTSAGYSQTYTYDTFKVLDPQVTKVTPTELLKYMDIPAENAKTESTIQMYIDQSEALILLEVPTFTTTENQSFLELMRQLILVKSAITYFMNMGENNINPEIRTQKIKLWTEIYNNACDKINSSLSSTNDAPGVTRRVANTSEDVVSPLSGSYYP